MAKFETCFNEFPIADRQKEAAPWSRPIENSMSDCLAILARQGTRFNEFAKSLAVGVLFSRCFGDPLF
jgi:hypothetical protein